MGRSFLATMVVAVLCSGADLRAQAPLQADLEPLVRQAPEPGFDSESELEPLVRATEELRGLSLLEPLQVETEGRAEAHETFSKTLIGSPEGAAIDHTLRLMGLWPDERSFEEVLLEVLAGEALGFYDSRSETLTMIEGDPALALPGFEAWSLSARQRLQRSTWVHEIGHALQDQHFDLPLLFGDDSFLSDRAVARKALVEGDATLLALSYFYSVELERFPPLAIGYTDLGRDPSALAGLFLQSSGKALAEAPGYLQQRLGFPYLGGVGFVLAARMAGGQKLLDHAFREDPPSSTEQILHPEKWLVRRDEPVALRLPELAPLLGDRPVALTGTLGELGVLTWLTEGLAEEGPDPEVAAAGWDGDRLALYRHGSEDPGVLVWISEWDSKMDVTEAYLAFRQMLPETAALTTADRRLAVVIGVEKPRATQVLLALLAAPANRPQRHPADLSALGITEADLPRPPVGDELVELFARPVIREAMKQTYGPEIAQFLELLGEEPEALEIISTLSLQILEMTNDPDLRKLLEEGNPGDWQSSSAVEAFVERRIERLGDEPTLEDNRVTMAEGRFVLALPESASWATQRNGDQARESGRSRDTVQMIDEISGATLLVSGMRGSALRLEPIVTEMESIAKNHGLRTVHSGYQEVEGYRFWEAVFQGERHGKPLHAVQRVYSLEESVVILAFSLPGGKENRSNGLEQELFGGIQLFSARPLPTVALGEANVVPPKKVRVVQPDFPSEARADLAQGTVVLRALVQRDGRVHPQIDVLRSPDDHLSRAAIRAVRQWLFEPARHGGEAVDLYYNLSVFFRIEEVPRGDVQADAGERPGE